MNLQLDDFERSTFNRRIAGPLGLAGLASGPLAFGIAHSAFGSWGISIGAMVLTGLFGILMAGQLADYFSMPRGRWYLVVSHFPPRLRVHDGNIDVDGHGSLNGYVTSFELVSDNESLTIKICGNLLLRRDTATLPWSKLELKDERFGRKKEHLAVIEIRGPSHCELVLPWCEKFSDCREGVWREQSNARKIVGRPRRRRLIDILPESEASKH